MEKKFVFSYQRERKQNPCTGIMSFQHFNGEKLYSDCITGQTVTAGIETENYECYPVPAGTAEDGRSEGFYPENTIAYIRILWKEFEPEQGQFRYSFIEQIIEDAKAHHQVLAFRIMPHSTCARDDVPAWLKKIMDCPKRPDGKRVKASPSDPRFLVLFQNAVRAFGERFDSDPTLYSMDISLVGAWGEGEGMEQYPKESLRALADTYIKAFPHTHLLAQLSNPELMHYIAQRRPIGGRGDGLGNKQNARYDALMQKAPADFWKTAPVSFECYWWISEWYRQGWNIDDTIEKTLRWHISSFNPKSFPLPEQWRDKIEYWVSKMGYHFTIHSVTLRKDASSLQLKLDVENVGSAPLYEPLPLRFRLKNADASYLFDTDIDLTKWIGRTEETVSLDIQALAGKTYALEIGIGGGTFPTAYFAVDAPYDDGFYVIDDALAL